MGNNYTEKFQTVPMKTIVVTARATISCKDEFNIVIFLGILWNLSEHLSVYTSEKSHHSSTGAFFHYQKITEIVLVILAFSLTLATTIFLKKGSLCS